MKRNNFNYFKNKFKPEKSFSLLGEDILIKSFFPPKYIGNYIDIGSGHPVFGNNTFLFYKKSWKGVLVDPNNDQFYKAEKNRTSDIILNYGIKTVNNQKNEDSLYYKKSWPEISSTNKEDFYLLKKFFSEYMQNDLILEKRIKLIDANELKKIFNVDNLDILSIDIETSCEDIILDFIKFYNPKVIVYEKNHKDKIRWNDFNYELISTNEMNNIIINKNYKKNNIFDY